MELFPSNPTLFSAGLLIVRVIFGVIMFAHGAQKVFGWFGGHGLAGTAGFMKQAYGIPRPAMYLGSFVELIGALAVILGVLTQIAALLLAGTQLIAAFVVHRRVGFWMNWGSAANRGEGYEYNLALIGMGLLLVLTGSGSFALLP